MKFGAYDVDLSPDRHWWLDAGTMFGIIPRALWGRRVETDKKHRMY